MIQLQEQAQFLLAEIESQTSSEVQYHEVCAVLSSIICLRLRLSTRLMMHTHAIIN